MGVRWTAEKDQQLLLLMVQIDSVKAKDLADKWVEVFGSDGAPTQRAITEHFVTLRKKQLPGLATPTKPGVSPKSTPGMFSNGKTSTPGSASKRKAMLLENEYDSEPEVETSTTTPRAFLSRKTKTEGKKPRLDANGDVVKSEDMTDSFEDFMTSTVRSGGKQNGFAASLASGGKPDTETVDLITEYDGDSDISEYSPFQ